MVYYKEYDSFLLTLRDLGVVHIRETHPAITDEHLQEILDFRKKLNLLLRDLKKSLPKDVLLTPAKTLSKEECLALITRIEELNRQKMQLSASLQAIGKDLDYLSIWGDFSYKTIQNLRKAGYEVSFYTIPASKYNPEWNEQYNAFLVNTYQSVSYFVTVTKAGIPVEIEAEKAKMPEKDKVGLKLLQEEFQIKMEKSNEELLQIVVNNYNSLLLFDKELQDEFFALYPRLGPFGHGNPQPTYRINHLEIVRTFPIKAGHTKGIVRDINGDTSDFIAFNMVIDARTTWDVIAIPHINEYYGEKRRQLQIVDAKPSVM